MPYIDVTISKKLSDHEKDALKTNFGALISILPEKSEKVLMIAIKDDCTMYFSGEKKDVAYLNIKLFKKSAYEYKNELTQKIFELFEREYGITPDNIFMSFDEYDKWATNGTLIQ